MFLHIKKSVAKATRGSFCFFKQNKKPKKSNKIILVLYEVSVYLQLVALGVDQSPLHLPHMCDTFIPRSVYPIPFELGSQIPLGEVSTGMGDLPGSPRDVSIFLHLRKVGTIGYGSTYSRGHNTTHYRLYMYSRGGMFRIHCIANEMDACITTPS